jgi:Endonuclease/Exonuclease/phosphatase family
MRREAPMPIRGGPIARVAAYHDSDEEESDAIQEKNVGALTDYPDPSQANRRPPRFKRKPHDIHAGGKYETKLFAMCGEFVCTAGYSTRVWSLLTGELLLSIGHGETTKATSVAFKPAKDVEEEGRRIWLGMNTGELHEVDIPTQSVVVTKTNAHQRFPVLRIIRHASAMWTIDEDGKWLIWPPDEDGLPSLDLTPHVCRVPKGATFTLIVGNQLWLAYGKEISIYQQNAANRTAMQVLQKPLVQMNVGDVTAGAVMSSQPDRVYFGHIDGKVTIYSRTDYSCLGIMNVSLYKISSLVGVGDYLWAGFNTGMIYVYDTTSQPWKVKKDWKAHHNTISGITCDRTSMWKLDRLQVASLGSDGLLRIWDGMLTEDWLELDMQEHDTEYCDFSEVTALVMTWNAGASKPTALRRDKQDDNFFRELLSLHNPTPDILVFGFQELVDLEDKKVTARSLFKSSKKKENVDHERMSHQYRAWKDHLTKCIDENMPATQSYTLLHTANLIGLFTCVFVKSSIRSRIQDVHAAQVKLGMGGLHGNKGALIVRFLLDDSSVCFINCHLAAGQRQTVHRNNDVAAIMEAECLPPQHDMTARSDMFVSGGDGSMILDHEICILNGDLNYRIDTIPRDTVIAAVKERNLAKLLDRDQLLVSRRKNPGFRLRAFNESPITFAPTYKYDVGTDAYDSSEKKRAPAWCDRLLYRGVGRIKQLDYRRHEVRVSDHRPVSGFFKLRVKTINSKRRAKTRSECEQRFEDVKARIAYDIK